MAILHLFDTYAVGTGCASGVLGAPPAGDAQTIYELRFRVNESGPSRCGRSRTTTGVTWTGGCDGRPVAPRPAVSARLTFVRGSDGSRPRPASAMPVAGCGG